MVMLGMPNHGLNRRSPIEQFAQLRGQIPPACDGDCLCFRTVALPAKAVIDECFLRVGSGQALYLGQHGINVVSIIGIDVCCIDPHNPVVSRGVTMRTLHPNS
jgi:hypothetical protein